MTNSSTDIRNDFPFFLQKKNGFDLIYFDNAATTHKPMSVINSISEFYSKYNSNVHRGEHDLSERATTNFELTRQKVQKQLNAKHLEEIVFTSGTTESINLVAQSFASNFLKKGDVILLSKMEHHSNIVPWQLSCEKNGAIIKDLDVNENGLIDINRLKKSINSRVKLIVFQHVSNVTGGENGVKEVVKICKKWGAYSCIDGAQAIAHKKIDVQEIDCDFYSFSGHKCFGPTGTGALYGKKKLLESMPPYMGGGEMISAVNIQKSSWNKLPYKFEAGTPNIAGFIGLGQALSYINKLGLNEINKLEKVLLDKLYSELNNIKNIIFYGKKGSIPICTFNIKGIHSYDLGALLNEQGICVRTGHLCAQPASVFFKTSSFIRVSLCFYNTTEEIHNFINCLKKSIKLLSK